MEASAWEAAGKPPVAVTTMLYGLAGLEFSHDGDAWTVRYRKWASDSGENKLVRVTGFSVIDHLVLAKTGRGWKISSLQRQREPLP